MVTLEDQLRLDSRLYHQQRVKEFYRDFRLVKKTEDACEYHSHYEDLEVYIILDCSLTEPTLSIFISDSAVPDFTITDSGIVTLSSDKVSVFFDSGLDQIIKMRATG